MWSALTEESYSRLAQGKHARAVKLCTAFQDSKSEDEYLRALKINDTFGISELLAKRRAFTLTPNINLLVLETKISWSAMATVYTGNTRRSMWSRRVRILDGDDAGLAAWINDKLLIPSTPP